MAYFHTGGIAGVARQHADVISTDSIRAANSHLLGGIQIAVRPLPAKTEIQRVARRESLQAGEIDIPLRECTARTRGSGIRCGSFGIIKTGTSASPTQRSAAHAACQQAIAIITVDTGYPVTEMPVSTDTGEIDAIMQPLGFILQLSIKVILPGTNQWMSYPQAADCRSAIRIKGAGSTAELVT